nr:immunoglobulin heavy chain junction region [Mus musculus]NSM04491.1 immunoglobulin heavy chain junction region [Mus musculus]NSM04510.1 immunoglobulin heavy chain junction region [Mus musculus]NSM04900.1 immunoglobulin heavy chain junction region [Mus musculus]NSM05053.1 immunoglobulin heavy chain junction region [Mus musculus]
CARKSYGYWHFDVW